MGKGCRGSGWEGVSERFGEGLAIYTSKPSFE